MLSTDGQADHSQIYLLLVWCRDVVRLLTAVHSACGQAKTDAARPADQANASSFWPMMSALMSSEDATLMATAGCFWSVVAK